MHHQASYRKAATARLSALPLQDAEDGAKAASSSATSKDKEVLQMEAQLQHHRYEMCPHMCAL